MSLPGQLRRWADARERRNAPGGHGSTGTELLRRAANEIDRLAAISRQRDLDVDAGGLSCIFCGCTDNAACEGGCGWVSTKPPICSRCAETDLGERVAIAIDLAEGALLGREPRRTIWTDADYLVAVLAALTGDGDRARRAALAEYARRPVDEGVGA